ncbi:unnamed protein product [Absidia cylindrospora]
MTQQGVQIACYSTDALVGYIAFTVYNVVQLPKRPSLMESNHGAIVQESLPSIETFIRLIFKCCRIPLSVFLFAILYLIRLQKKLSITKATGKFDTPYRLFLAAILVSSKYLCEAGTHLTNRELANRVSLWFTCQDINRMERSFLHLLGYELWVSPLTLAGFVSQHGTYLKLQLQDPILLKVGSKKTVVPKKCSRHFHSDRAFVDMNHDSLVLRSLLLDVQHHHHRRHYSHQFGYRIYQDHRKASLMTLLMTSH